MKRLFVLAGLLALLAFPAMAQQQTNTGVAVIQNATRNDSATFLYGPVGGAAACNTINTSAANATVTIPAQANLSIYITGIYADIFSNATGVASLATLSSTNLTGAPFWSLGTNLAASTAPATARQFSETYPTGLKATQPGVPVTLVPSAANAQAIICIRAAGFYAN